MNDANVAIITTRLDAIEEGFVRHEAADDRRFKYSHNMQEDALDKLASLERSQSYYEGERVIRGEAEKARLARDADTEMRLRTIERLIYVAIGSIMILGTTFALISQRVINLLSVHL